VCKGPSTWSEPTQRFVVDDEHNGQVEVTARVDLQPKIQQHPGHGSCGRHPIARGTRVRVAATRLTSGRAARVLWLWWAGSVGGTSDLDLL
jgi:hypothetical protein